ncbi:uncharacterized protein CDV56_101690 [Aspergillus thermomutatus]|uniref:Velvet domain-containing protein n=1 Tax=Aspergillus thermomutatus TaxID=41047 RepID=A0A397G1L4_ASPTH|nr:uncharacterized protein CDV56_101690 [Aspergillus thermomutatus]RHZ43428.1 hypothetical protein CDV56_101690 [Aspergillus thermomutatus]
MLSNTSSDFELIIRQQPNRARVAGGKEKERKPVDPPPIVQLRVREEGSYLAQHYLQSPYYFMCCSLYDANEDQPVPVPPATALAGTLVSSLHRLKDVDNNDGGFFVFGDLSVKIEGEFRLKFTLFEMRKDVVTYLKSIISDRFTVSPPKTFPGMQESTFLSRSFADQGVKLRIRKEPRTLSLKRPPRPEEYPQQPLPRSPDRSSMQMSGNAFSGYPAAGRDYAYYGTPVKRQRTSVDYGNRGVYDAEGRMRQVDAYPQTAAMYPNQPGTYQTPMMQGYPTGHAGVPDYAVRQPQPALLAPSSYGSPVVSMVAVTSPGPGNMAQARNPAYTDAQISYGIPSSAQVPQMQDPAAQARSSQQATMQSLGMMNQPDRCVRKHMAAPARGGEAHVSSLPQRSPEFSSLEIRGTWNGDELEPVDLRISLEILNTRSANISLIKTFSVRLQSNEWGQGNQSSDSSPQSPLFAFSAPESDDGTSSHNSGTPERDLFTAAKESPTSSQNATVSSSLEGVADYPNDQEVEPSSQLSSSPLNLSSELRLNVAACADWIKTQNPGRKRSASDASLTDSGSGSERTKASGVKPSAKCIISDVGGVKSAPEPDKLTQNATEGNEDAVQFSTQSSERSSHGRHSRTLSMIPKPVTRLDKDVVRRTVSIPAPDALQDTSTAAHSKQPIEEEDAPTPTQATVIETFRRKRGDSDFFVTSTTEMFPGSLEANEPVAAEVTKTTRSDSDKDSPKSTLGMHNVVGGLRIQTEPEGVTRAIDQHVEPETSSPKSHQDMTAPETPGSRVDRTLAHNATDYAAFDREDCQSSMSEPKLELKDGILFIRNRENVRSATYKFAITVSVLLEKDKSKGWSNLVIPGLPRMRAGESGFFLFLIPENHGLEFRTTNLQRYKIVENCFFAEFVNRGDLVVPLRVCDQKFYGIVKDFTVDQEIRAEHQVIANLDHEGKDIQADVMINYTAMCSLRLHNRCFWAEKCCFFLRLDGGPDTRFHCRLEPQETGLQMINLESKEIPVGVSYLQIICSPKDLEMFGVTWKVKLPGQQAINWLPRIYPVSSTTCESNRNNLRQIFTELEAEYSKETAHKLARVVEFDQEHTVRVQHNADILDISDPEDGEEDLVQSEEVFFEEPFPPEAKTQSLTTSIANIVADSMAYCMQSLIISLCISMIWMILTSYVEIPPCPGVSNCTLSETDTNLTVVNSELMGLAIPSHEDRESRPELLDNELAPERAIASDKPEIIEQSYMADVGLNGQELGHADHNETEDIQEKVVEVNDTPTAGVKSGSDRYEDQPHSSFRDRIDYWLGWKGPTGDEL